MSVRASSAMERFIESGVFVADPVPWLLHSGEPYTVWATLTGLLNADEAAIRDAHAAVLTDTGVTTLIAELPGWGDKDFPGHHSPQFLPNRLNLLADMGVGARDDERIEALLDKMLAQQTPAGAFRAFGRYRKQPEPEWGSLPCDTNAITDVLLRFGRAEDERVRRAVANIVDAAAPTPQGRAWQCVSGEDGVKFRGPGRKTDACPQVTLEGLRAISHVPAEEQPDWVLDAARTPLRFWRRRTDERPYMFGHGFQFKSVKWPNFWYDVLWVLETVGRFPGLWRGRDASEADRQSLAEMAACLIEYNFDPDQQGRVTPQRTYRGFESFSFGQKMRPSPFATARALIALARLSDLAEDISDVNVLALPSSKGGTGSPRPPSTEAAPLCLTRAPRPYPLERVMPRVLTRQHLDVSWDPASIESVVSDIVALDATHMSSVYLALQARLPGFTKGVLEDALYSRRSLLRVRGMRGMLCVIRRDLLPAVHGATAHAVVRYARRFAEERGLTAEQYEAVVPRILDALDEEPLTSRELRKRLGVTDVDLGAVLTLMSAEMLILRDRPRGGWLDRQTVWTPMSVALPDGPRLDALDLVDARAQLLVAYVRAFGPATARDAAWWTGMSPDHVRRTVKRLEDELVEVTLTGSDEIYLMHATDVEELERATLLSSPLVSLLPAMDPLLVGYANRSRLLDDAARPFVFDGRGSAAATIVSDGHVIGVWEVEGIAGEVKPQILVHLLTPQPAPVVDAVEARAAAVARFSFDAEAAVVFAEEMEPLANRPPGSFLRPLSGPGAAC